MLGSNGTNKQAGTVPGATALTVEDAEQFQSELRAVYERDESIYQWALKAGVPKELARIHLPVGRYSKMRASANLRNWLGFLSLRLPENAQYEIRVFAEAVANLIREAFPRTAALFDEGHK